MILLFAEEIDLHFDGAYQKGYYYSFVNINEGRYQQTATNFGGWNFLPDKLLLRMSNNQIVISLSWTTLNLSPGLYQKFLISTHHHFIASSTAYCLQASHTLA